MHTLVREIAPFRLITMDDVAAFLLRNGGMNGHDLNIDGGWLLT
ncbi:hypothetical protein [Kutzneria sp. CA-103260]|nr:hypothetical protein [Kutzneria sp. CA-103260]QUQ65920.1 hypothetical protein JJ691_36450 [Kutzneria sp. CA-103260]